jgi:hypothetical protein
MAEYVGSTLYLKFGSTTLQADFRSFEPNETIDTVDSSAGSDTFKTKLSTLKDGKATVELVDQTGGSALWTAVVPGASGTLEWGPEGTAVGKPRHYCDAIVTGRTKTIPYSDIVVLKVEWAMAGAVTDTAY